MKVRNSSKSYIAEFDALRAFAVIAVMIRHYFSQFWFLEIFGSGGVTLFFVLSGYLITQILLFEKNKYDMHGLSKLPRLLSILKVFYLRRTLRIFPLYYFVLIVLVILNIDTAREFWYYYFFYFSNHLYGNHFVIDRLSHFWSLAVEEQFYLVWPLLILLIPFRWRSITFFAGLVVLSQAFIFWAMFADKNQGWNNLMPSCVESFSLGAIALLLSDKHVPVKYLNITLIISVLLLFGIVVVPYIHPTFLTSVYCSAFERLVASILFTAIVLVVIKGYCISIVKKLLNNRILLLLGKISYGIYVYHMFVPTMLQYFLDKLHISLQGTGLQMLLNFLISFGIAYLSFFFFELPINSLKKRFAY